MKIKYDKETDSKYITVKDGKVVRTEKQKDWLLFDLDKNGRTLGVEILNVSRNPISLVITDGLVRCFSAPKSRPMNSLKAPIKGEFSREHIEEASFSSLGLQSV